MVVCLCQGVAEKDVREAIADGATTRKKVTRACGAGAGCGGCHQSIREIIDEHRAAARSCGRRPSEGTFEEPAAAAIA